MPTTRDHEEIKKWSEAHDAHPALVKSIGDEEGEGVLRFDFGEPNENLERIGWDDFFKVFDRRGLALRYDEEPESKFHKFVYP